MKRDLDNSEIADALRELDSEFPAAIAAPVKPRKAKKKSRLDVDQVIPVLLLMLMIGTVLSGPITYMVVRHVRGPKDRVFKHKEFCEIPVLTEEIYVSARPGHRWRELVERPAHSSKAYPPFEWFMYEMDSDRKTKSFNPIDFRGRNFASNACTGDKHGK